MYNAKETSEIQRKMISTLVEYLNNANTMYYYGNPIIDDAEYDEQLRTLENLEKETGYVLSSSPTQHAGYIVKDKINVVKHSS
ncbi:MAG: NAD-dependent DNA ligase LigA, partial [Bacilli bacterium]|nr:NAD-dependent DNA ligase LigA [Bacilli bacterium]